jgi:hypothetical protein
VILQSDHEDCLDCIVGGGGRHREGRRQAAEKCISSVTPPVGIRNEKKS